MARLAPGRRRAPCLSAPTAYSQLLIMPPLSPPTNVLMCYQVSSGARTVDHDYVDGHLFRSANIPFTAPQQAPMPTATGPTPLLTKDLGDKWTPLPYELGLYAKGLHIVHYWKQPIEQWEVGKITQVCLTLSMGSPVPPHSPSLPPLYRLPSKVRVHT